jgi:hypothetical protein
VAEGGGLLNRYTLQRRIEGSNPSVSAKSIQFHLPIPLRAPPTARFRTPRTPVLWALHFSVTIRASDLSNGDKVPAARTVAGAPRCQCAFSNKPAEYT